MTAQDIRLLIMTGTESPLTRWNDETNSENLVELWRKSQISRELERLLSSQELSVESKRRRLDSDAPILSAPGLTESFAPQAYQYNQPRNGQVFPQKSAWPDKRIDRRLTNDFRDSPKLTSYEVSPIFYFIYLKRTQKGYLHVGCSPYFIY